jgi:hypothetical protein
VRKKTRFLTYQLENGERLSPAWGLQPNVGDRSAECRVKSVIPAPTPAEPKHVVVIFEALPRETKSE